MLVKLAVASSASLLLPSCTSNLPVAAYNVSGEHPVMKSAVLNGWIDEQRVVLETLTSFKRVGADLILTYHAKDAARWLS